MLYYKISFAVGDLPIGDLQANVSVLKMFKGGWVSYDVCWVGILNAFFT